MIHRSHSSAEDRTRVSTVPEEIGDACREIGARRDVVGAAFECMPRHLAGAGHLCHPSLQVAEVRGGYVAFPPWADADAHEGHGDHRS